MKKTAWQGDLDELIIFFILGGLLKKEGGLQ